MAAIAEDLVRWFREAAVDGLVIPLGLGHPDHRMAADAGLMLAESEHPECVYVYEELPYAVEDAGDVACRKELLAQRGFSLAEDGALEFLDDRALKKAVFRCHTSQRRQLRWRARKAVRTPERVWKLVRSLSGWPRKFVGVRVRVRVLRPLIPRRRPRVRPDHPPSLGPGMIPLMIPEIKRLPAARTTQPVPQWLVIHWDTWTRRHQARSP